MTDADGMEVQRRVQTALEQLAVLDRQLLANDANERAITHRLAVYLENHFDGWDVDCEYDGWKRDPQRVDELVAELARHEGDEPLVRDTSGRTVHPDIIVHQRGSSRNLLAIEVKKDSSDVPDHVDRAKLDLQKDDPELGFRYACLVRVRVGPSVRPSDGDSAGQRDRPSDGQPDGPTDGQPFEIEFI